MDELPESIAAIIVGHTHFDHALDIPAIAKDFAGPLVGSRSLETLMSLHDMPGRVTICKGGERVDLMPEAAVTMLPTKHGIIGDSVPYPGEIDPGKKPPLKVDDYKLGTIYIAKLELGGTTFAMAGSANFIPEQLAGHSCDVLFMCVVGWDKSPEYAANLPGMLKPRVIVPYHSDNFFVPLPLDRKAPQMPNIDMEGFVETVLKSAPEAEIRRIDTFEYTEF
ncbi:MAG: MBL fold metallo-hydrolase [Proteobacteria bacterium]|nr:MBL fold metallo-hydrolase [Pseudomonadota bacterium]